MTIENSRLTGENIFYIVNYLVIRSNKYSQISVILAVRFSKLSEGDW